MEPKKYNPIQTGESSSVPDLDSTDPQSASQEQTSSTPPATSFPPASQVFEKGAADSSALIREKNVHREEQEQSESKRIKGKEPALSSGTVGEINAAKNITPSETTHLSAPHHSTSAVFSSSSQATPIPVSVLNLTSIEPSPADGRIKLAKIELLTNVMGDEWNADYKRQYQKDELNIAKDFSSQDRQTQALEHIKMKLVHFDRICNHILNNRADYSQCTVINRADPKAIHRFCVEESVRGVPSDCQRAHLSLIPRILVTHNSIRYEVKDDSLYKLLNVCNTVNCLINKLDCEFEVHGRKKMCNFINDLLNNTKSIDSVNR